MRDLLGNLTYLVVTVTKGVLAFVILFVIVPYVASRGVFLLATYCSENWAIARFMQLCTFGAVLGVTVWFLREVRVSVDYTPRK